MCKKIKVIELHSNDQRKTYIYHDVLFWNDIPQYSMKNSVGKVTPPYFHLNRGNFAHL